MYFLLPLVDIPFWKIFLFLRERQKRGTFALLLRNIYLERVNSQMKNQKQIVSPGHDRGPRCQQVRCLIKNSFQLQLIASTLLEFEKV